MRNKIYVTKEMPLEQQEQCCFVDVGKVLSNAYKNAPVEFAKESKFDAFYYFRRIIDSFIEASKTRIVFSNLGILLEKDFSSRVVSRVPSTIPEEVKNKNLLLSPGKQFAIDSKVMTLLPSVTSSFF